MRPDFARVVTERPRHGSSNRSLKIRRAGEFNTQSADWEDWDYEGGCRVPSSGRRMQALAHGIEYKNFSDLLGPVHRYLNSCVGRLWNDVYSELSQNLGRGTWPVRHVLDQHIDVVVHTQLGKDGKVYGAAWRWSQRLVCVSETDYGGRDQFYVHPITGRLRRSLRTKRQKKTKEVMRCRINAERWFVRLDELWYIGRYEPRPGGPVRDSVFPDTGAEVFVKIKQASHKELRGLHGAMASAR